MKKILAIAIASAFAAPAFAATSNVDVYGIVNVSVNSINDDVANKDRSTSVSSHASRVGFKGSEDLGGGLAAIWQIETGFNADENAGLTGGRNAFVGLKGGFGTVLMGKHDTPMKMLGRKVDNFGDLYADSRNLLGADAAAGTSNFDLRTNNTIAYISPNFSGVTVIGAYVADHGVSGGGTFTNCATNLDCNDRNAYSVSADYVNGPLMLGAAYERHNTNALVAAVNTGVDRSLWRMVAGYKFGDAKLGALYENGSADAALVTADRNAWGVFGDYAIGAITLKANYLKVGDYKGVSSSGAKQYTLGADYSLSKRTTAYAYYAKIKNDTNAAFDLGVGGGVSDGTLTTADADPTVLGLGMKHSF
jgi:predicted porin